MRETASQAEPAPGESPARPALIPGQLPLLVLRNRDAGAAFTVQLGKWKELLHYPTLLIASRWPSSALTVSLVDQKGRQETVCQQEWASLVRESLDERARLPRAATNTTQVLLLRADALEGYAEVRIRVNPSVAGRDDRDETMGLVQIFNAAPASTRSTLRLLPQFFLLSAFSPSCLEAFDQECDHPDRMLHPMLTHLPVDGHWLPQHVRIERTPQQPMPADAQPLFAPTVFQFYECRNDSRLAMRQEATHVFADDDVRVTDATVGHTLRFHTRPLPAAAGEVCNSRGHHLVLLTDPRISYQVTFESDYVGFATGFLGLYLAYLIPASFVWYFAALAYQFYCWRVLGSFPPLVATLHRLAAHFTPVFVALYVVARVFPYFQLVPMQPGLLAFSWGLTSDRDAALSPHLFLMVPFLSCMAVLGLGYAQAIGLALGSPLLRRLGACRAGAVGLCLRGLSLFGQRAAKRVGHAWKALTRSALVRLAFYALVALCSLVDSLYVSIPLVAVLTAYRPNHPQEKTSGWNFRRTWAVLFLLRIVQSFVCLNNPFKLGLGGREFRVDSTIVFGLAPLVFGCHAVSMTNSALPKDRLMTFAPAICALYILFFGMNAPFRITILYSTYALFMFFAVAFHRWRKRNGLA